MRFDGLCSVKSTKISSYFLHNSGNSSKTESAGEGVAHDLLYAIHRRHQSGWMTFGWSLLDLGLALGFLFLITILIALVLGGLNGVAVAWANKPLMNLNLIFNNICLDPFHKDIVRCDTYLSH